MATMSRRRALAALLLVLVAAAAYSVRIRGGMADFTVFYRAGGRLAAGELLYQPADGHFMFKYLPASALLFVPLARLPLDVAEAVWFALSLLALAWSFVLVRRLVPRPHVRYLLLASGLVLAKYFLHELRLGQINIVVMTVLLLATRALAGERTAGRDATAGVLAGIATALKPYAVVFLPYFLIKRNWVACAAGVGVLALAVLVPALFYGVHGNTDLLRAWVATLSQSTPTLLTNADNVSVPAFFAKWLGASTPAFVASAIVLAALGLLMLMVILRGEGRRDDATLEGALLLTLIPLASPLGWDYTLLASLLAVALVVNAFDQFPRPVRVALVVNLAVIALALFDLMGRRAYATFMAWSVTTVNFLIVVAALAWLRLRRRQTTASTSS